MEVGLGCREHSNGTEAGLVPIRILLCSVEVTHSNSHNILGKPSTQGSQSTPGAPHDASWPWRADALFILRAGASELRGAGLGFGQVQGWLGELLREGLSAMGQPRAIALLPSGESVQSLSGPLQSAVYINFWRSV